jgi:hypothetical protein
MWSGARIMDIGTNNVLRRFVVNYLVYEKGFDLNEAHQFFSENCEHFEKVFEMFGEDLFDIIGKGMKEE